MAARESTRQDPAESLPRRKPLSNYKTPRSLLPSLSSLLPRSQTWPRSSHSHCETPHLLALNPTVFIGFIDRLTPIPSRGDVIVIVSPGKLDAQWSCHALTASCLSAIKLDLSPFSCPIRPEFRIEDLRLGEGTLEREYVRHEASLMERRSAGFCVRIPDILIHEPSHRGTLSQQSFDLVSLLVDGTRPSG
jgi:hypothetical protein